MVSLHRDGYSIQYALLKCFPGQVYSETAMSMKGPLLTEVVKRKNGQANSHEPWRYLKPTDSSNIAFWHSIKRYNGIIKRGVDVGGEKLSSIV